MTEAEHTTPVLLDKLAKVCARFGSNFDGERSTAAKLADQMVREAGLTWPDMIALRPPTRRRSWREPNHISSAVDMCLAFPIPLTEWERGFAASVASCARFTAKQKAVMERIIDKCRHYAAMKEAADG